MVSDLSEDTILRMMQPRDWGWSVGEYDAKAVAAADKALASKIEAVLILARGVTDEHGKVVMFRIPPALALAIIDTLACADPLARACDVTEEALAKLRRQA